MDKIAIILRKDQATNIFRSIILNVFSSKLTTEILLGSGFYQQGHKKSAYYASDDVAASVYNKNCKKIHLVGVHNATWVKQFYDFINKIKVNFKCCSKNNIFAYKPKSLRWHAKIMIAKVGSVPAVAIIGSSNMTKNAFAKMSKNWNYESDVIMWNSKNEFVNNMVREVLQSGKDNYSIIIANYDISDELNTGIDLENQLNDLWEYIIKNVDEIII